MVIQFVWVITVNKVRSQNDQQNSIQLLNCCGKADYDITGIFFARMDEAGDTGCISIPAALDPVNCIIQLQGFLFRPEPPQVIPGAASDSRMEALI